MPIAVLVMMAHDHEPARVLDCTRWPFMAIAVSYVMQSLKSSLDPCLASHGRIADCFALASAAKDQGATTSQVSKHLAPSANFQAEASAKYYK